jgi:hypothetical protein
VRLFRKKESHPQEKGEMSIFGTDDQIYGYCPNCEPLRAQLEKVEAELSKWKRPHDDADLEEMRLQAKGNSTSLAAMQAYINALEHHLQHAYQRGAREMRERAAELAHPIDECLFDDIMDLPTGSSESAKV